MGSLGGDRKGDKLGRRGVDSLNTLGFVFEIIGISCDS